VLLNNKAPSRGTLTHIAFICDDPGLQPRLPQIIVGNEHTLSKADLLAAQTFVPQNVYLIRSKSSWADAPLFAASLRWLGKATAHLKSTHRVVVVLDCCGVHLHHVVRSEARRGQMYLCFVPAGMTWLLQPCDTHVFRRYKSTLRNLFSRQQVLMKTHALGTDTLIKSICESIRMVLQGNDWTSAFDHNGYGHQQALVSARVASAIQMSSILPHTEGACSLDDLAVILPRKRVLDASFLQNWNMTGRQGSAHVPAEGVGEAAAESIILESDIGTGTQSSGCLQNMDDTLPEEGATDTSWHTRLRQRRPRGSSSSGPPPPLRTPLESPPPVASSPPCPSWMLSLRRLPPAPPSERRRPSAPRG